MERLINHLQQSLDDDEAAKDALLLLRTGSSGSFGTSSGNPNSDVHESERKILIEENSNVFILQSITSRILKDCVSPMDLPIKIAAMHLDISPKLIVSLCTVQSVHPWNTKFTGCLKQVLDIHEWCVERKCLLISPAQEAKLKYLREEIQRMQDEPYGAVARFILGTIVDFISMRAVPMPLQLPTHPLAATVPCPASPSLTLGTREIDLRELVINSCGAKEQQRGAGQEDDGGGMKVILLAPLTLKPRSTKHFIVPLMEPDLLGTFGVEFPPLRIVALHK